MIDLFETLKHFYSRVTSVIIANDKTTIALFPAVLNALQRDSGLQELLPFFSRFIYQKVRNINYLFLFMSIFMNMYYIVI